MRKKIQCQNPFLQQIPEIVRLYEDADVVDLKSIKAPVTLREFIAGTAGYRPAFMSRLFGIRNLFARLLGLEADNLPPPSQLRPEEISMTPGEKMLFTVKTAEEDLYWIAGEEESHLGFDVAIAVEPMTTSLNRIYVITFVRYKRMVGRFYFFVIAPFHHLLVHLSMRAAISKKKTGQS